MLAYARGTLVTAEPAAPPLPPVVVGAVTPAVPTPCGMTGLLAPASLPQPSARAPTMLSAHVAVSLIPTPLFVFMFLLRPRCCCHRCCLAEGDALSHLLLARSILL
jgi:hypothetical protein